MSSLKVCTKCKCEKDLSEFKLRKDSKSGYRTTCKSCDKETNDKWKQENKEHLNKMYREVYYKKHRSKNHEAILERERKRDKARQEYKTEYMKKWRKENPDKIKEVNLRQRPKQYAWLRAHPELVTYHSGKRRAAEKNATPPWVDEDHLNKIKEIYKSARARSEFHEMQFDVDHIEPLQGKNSCGLHVFWNLQVLEHSENIRKSNKENYQPNS